MKAVVVSHGSVRDLEHFRNVFEESDIIVCADGGAEYVLGCGLTPDALIGDLDSIDDVLLDKIKNTGCVIKKYPREKDYTDTQLALEYAIEAGATEITMVGSIGDRMDHTLANIFLLVKLLKQGIKACMIDEKNIIHITDSEIKLSGAPGDLVSLIPVGGDVEGICTYGMMYKLTDAAITMGDPLGISNVFLGHEARVTIKSGYLLAIRSID